MRPRGFVAQVTSVVVAIAVTLGAILFALVAWTALTGCRIDDSFHDRCVPSVRHGR